MPLHPTNLMAPTPAHRMPAALEWMATSHRAFSTYDFERGHAALDRCLAIAPDFLPAQWARFQLPRAVAHPDASSIVDFRRRWREGIDHFSALDWESPRWREQIWGCVGQCTSFYRHYLGDDVLDEQRAYGQLVARMMRALAGEPPLPAPVPRARRRIAFISAYTYEHPVARLFGPLLANLDGAKFETHLLQLDPRSDVITQSIIAGMGRTHAGPREARDWVNLLGSIAPDVIVHTDIGMHPLSQALAALRLAPVQACLWGHPVTTGLENVDVMLGSDLLEPADGASHYSERLLRLPGIGAGLEAPSEAARLPHSWPVDTGSGDTAVEILFAQSAFKLMPEQAEHLVAVLAACPQARLHLTPSPVAAVRRALLDRLGQLLQAAGGNAERQLVSHPLLGLREFRGLAGQCDLALDSIGWSGGMSSLDLLGEGLPIVALPGASMRSRQTAALLAHLGVPELIARDPDDYRQRAIELVRDSPRRNAIRERIRAARGRLYNTAPVHRAFAEFLDLAPSRVQE